PLATLAPAPLLLAHRLLALFHRRAIGLGEVCLVILVVDVARLLVGEHLVRRRQLLEPLGEDGPALPHVLAIPGGGVDPLAPLHVGAADGAAVHIGAHPQKLIIGYTIATCLKIPD